MRRLYVHIPFCHHICPYCSFYKHTPARTDFNAFVEALLTELDRRRKTIELTPESIYFGGGTPSFLSRTYFERLLSALRDRLDLSRLEEWTVEANPATFGIEKARLLRGHGVTRISLGVQSWLPRDLALLGRDHSPADAEDAFRILREAGFDNINVDLMFSIPGQTTGDWEESLRRTIDLGPEHVSAYNLTYEEDTEFMTRHRAGELDSSPDRDAEQFLLAEHLLSEAGFHHYEISNYARPGRASVHNAAYWAGEDYLGLGPSAVTTTGARRQRNVNDTASYIRRTLAGEPAVDEEEELSPANRTNEAIALQLRTAEGLPRAVVEHVSDEQLDALEAEELLVRDSDGDNERLHLTTKGKLLADSVAEYLLV